MSLIRFETHCHSVFSPDSLNSLENLIAVARKRNITKLAITDHNTIEGALQASELDPDLVIVSEEILTTKGELLAFFVTETIPGGLDPMAAIERLKDQGAFISVSHPFDRLRHGWELEDLEEITPYIDAIEIFNARSFTKGVNENARKYAVEKNLKGTVGSDAHTLSEVGTAILLLPEFSDANSLRIAMALTEINAEYSSPLVRFGSMYAKVKKKYSRKI